MQPDRAERAAFEVVRRVLGAEVEHRDTGAADRQGEVDGHIVYADGSRGAIEVTVLVDPREAQIESHLARDDFVWAFPDLTWCWLGSWSPTTRIDEARENLPVLLRWCEAAGVGNPNQLHGRGHPLMPWFRLSGLDVHAAPELTHRAGQVHLTAGGMGGAVGGVEDIVPWLSDVLTGDHCARKISKLARSGLREQHLFLVIDSSGASFQGFYALVWGQGVPTTVPALAADLTRVWLAPRFGNHVFTYDRRTGWERHEPYEERQIGAPDHGRGQPDAP